jgi:CheY-like chemotaxis protein
MAAPHGDLPCAVCVCASQVAVLGGQIGALSKPNCGSVFWFTIPLREPAVSSAAPAPAPAAAAASAPESPLGPEAGGIGAGHPRRTSLEQQLTQLWGAGDGSSNSSQRRASLATLRPQSGEGEATAAAAAAAAGPALPRPSSEACLGSSFGWYHLPPAGGAARTAANRLQPTPMAAGSWPAALSAPGVAPKPAIPTPAASGAFSHAGRGYGLWVLLAEDNLINQTVARKMLGALGMKCEVVANGREAVTAMQRAHESGMNFDCVLMDMCMPVLNGVDATKVRRRAASPFSRRVGRLGVGWAATGSAGLQAGLASVVQTAMAGMACLDLPIACQHAG